MSLAFEFVAIVGIMYLVGHWLGGGIGGGVGAVIGWMGGTLRIYFRYMPESPLETVKKGRE